MIQKNEFIAKLHLISKFMASKICRVIIKIHILLHISRIISNQTMKLVMRNVSLEKSYTKCGRETRPILFKKKKKIAYISGSTIWTFIQFVFIVCPR